MGHCRVYYLNLLNPQNYILFRKIYVNVVFSINFTTTLLLWLQWRMGQGLDFLLACFFQFLQS